MSILVKLGLAKETQAEISARESKNVVTIQTPITTPAKTGGRRRASVDVEDTDSDTDTSSTPTNKDVEVRLRKAVQSSAGDGFDYVKFTTMVKKNKALGEDGSYSAALTAAETMGVSVDELVSSAQNAIKAVNTESKKIDADLAEQAEQNATDQTELKKINAQISSLETRKDTLSKKIDSESSNIEDSQKSLESTVDLVTDEIKNVVTKIKKNSK